MASLRAQSILVNSAPAPDTPKKHFSPRVLVSYGDSVLWSFAIKECQTWFALLSHFFEFWPRRFRLQHNGNLLSSAHWPRSVRNAEEFGHDVYLNFELGSAHDMGQKTMGPTAGDLPVHESIRSTALQYTEHKVTGAQIKARSGELRSQNDGDNSIPPEHMDEKASHGHKASSEFQQPAGISWSSKHFHVFLWLFARKSQNPITGEGSADVHVNDTLESIHVFLGKETSPSERAAYVRCPDYAQSATLHFLEEAENIAPGVERSKAEQRDHEQKVDVVHAAISVFSFFFPQHYQGPTIRKFWGAIHEALAFQVPDQPGERALRPHRRGRRRGGMELLDDAVPQFSRALENLARKLRTFQGLFSQASPSERARINIPEALWKAWMHLVMSVVLFISDSPLWLQHLATTLTLVDEGMRTVTREATVYSLLGASVLLPLELSSIISLRLLRDVTGGHQDILETYQQYMKGLVLVLAIVYRTTAYEVHRRTS